MTKNLAELTVDIQSDRNVLASKSIPHTLLLYNQGLDQL